MKLSGDIVEPLLKPQCFLQVGEMSKRASEAAVAGSLTFDPVVNEKLWAQWLKNDR